MLTLLSNGGSAVIGLVTYGLVARILTEDELGIWAFFLMVFTLYDMSRTGLLSNAMIKMWGETDVESEQDKLLGSAWQLAGMTSFGFFILSLAFYWLYPLTPWPAQYQEVPLYFGVVVLLSLPQTLSMWLLNARMQFDRLLYLRLLLIVPYMIGAFVLFMQYGEAPLENATVAGESVVLHKVFLVYLGSFALVSIACMLLGWSGIRSLLKGVAEKRWALFHFGKFSMGTLISSNLLKSSDTFLLMFFRGSGAVAVYNVPERLLGIMEIPVRSMVQATYPKLTRLGSTDSKAFRDSMHAETGLLTLLMLPLSTFVFVFAEFFVVWLGGEKYADSAGILRVFAIYMAFVPMDRYAGVSMDAIGKPELNFRKVLLMLSINVIGDLIVLLLGGGAFSVAMVSVVTFGSGVLYGFYLLRSEFVFSPATAISLGWQTIKKARDKNN